MVDFSVAVLIARAKSEIEECDLPTVEKAIQDGSHLIVDVREPGEFSLGHLTGAINVPRGVLEFRTDPSYPGSISSLSDKAAKIILYCRSGGRSALAAQSLGKLGYKAVVSMAGGFVAWEDAKLPVVND
jgi:rhodanese-related sulfurtransferase